MVLARSIRRKLIVGLALVLVMMATLSISGLGGLWSYRQAVRELNFSVFEAPDRERLEAELARLSGRSWGRLPGTLKTEILQAARRDPNGDYAQLIRFYFEEISRSARQRSDTPTP